MQKSFPAPVPRFHCSRPLPCPYLQVRGCGLGALQGEGWLANDSLGSFFQQLSIYHFCSGRCGNFIFRGNQEGQVILHDPCIASLMFVTLAFIHLFMGSDACVGWCMTILPYWFCLVVSPKRTFIESHHWLNPGWWRWRRELSSRWPLLLNSLPGCILRCLPEEDENRSS